MNRLIYYIMEILSQPVHTLGRVFLAPLNFSDLANFFQFTKVTLHQKLFDVLTTPLPRSIYSNRTVTQSN